MPLLALLLTAPLSPLATVRAAEASGFVGVAAYSRGKTGYTVGAGGMRRDERFPVCSVTKLFTAALVLREVDRGRLTLDDLAADRLPECADALGTTTIRDLLYHSSSLRNMDDLGPGYDDVYTVRGKSDADPLATMKRLAKRGDAPPETRFAYNNLDAIALAAILARLRGTTYPRLVEIEIVRPLGLTRTSVLTAPALPSDVRRSKDAPPNLAIYSGAGAVLSTASDLLRFGRALLEGPFLSESSRALLLAGEPRFGYIGPATFRTTIAVGGETLAVVDRPGGIGSFSVRMELVPKAGTVTLVATPEAKPDIGAVYSKSGLAYGFLTAVLNRE